MSSTGRRVSAASLMAPFVLGRDALDIRAAYADMRKRYVPLGHVATSLFDIALHDGKAKTSGQPIYRMLGASRDEIRAYASSPLLPSDQAYIDYCRQRYEQGFRAIKIHPYCVFDDDMRLVRTLIETFAERSIGWSLDVDGMYTFDQALRMGRVLDEAGWEFMEAPLPDTDLGGYKALTDALDLDVICSGNSFPDPQLIEFALQMGAWDRSRFDVTGIGGFTGAGEVVAAISSPRQDLRSAELGIHPHAGGEPAPDARSFDLPRLRAGHTGRDVRIRRQSRSYARTRTASSARAACPGWGSRWTGSGSSPASTRGARSRHDGQDRAGGGGVPPGPAGPPTTASRAAIGTSSLSPRATTGSRALAKATHRPRSSRRRSRWRLTIIWPRGSAPS